MFASGFASTFLRVEPVCCHPLNALSELTSGSPYTSTAYSGDLEQHRRKNSGVDASSPIQFHAPLYRTLNDGLSVSPVVVRLSGLRCMRNLG